MAKDKKSVSDVNHIVKKSNSKLSELQAELQELDSQLLVTQGNLPNSPLAGTQDPALGSLLSRNIIYVSNIVPSSPRGNV